LGTPQVAQKGGDL